MTHPKPPVFELRVALTTSDYERLVKFYCDGLGIEPAAIWNNDGGKAMMLNMGNATLELFDERQAEVIDGLEAGKRISGQVRLPCKCRTCMPRCNACLPTAPPSSTRRSKPRGAIPTFAYRTRMECK